jgi:hypothetical protein
VKRLGHSPTSGGAILETIPLEQRHMREVPTQDLRADEAGDAAADDQAVSSSRATERPGGRSSSGLAGGPRSAHPGRVSMAPRRTTAGVHDAPSLVSRG